MVDPGRFRRPSSNEPDRATQALEKSALHPLSPLAVEGNIVDSYFVPAGALETLSRLKKRPVAIMNAGITGLDGQLLNPRTGAVLRSEEAYETVYGAVREEPLGTAPYLEMN